MPKRTEPAPALSLSERQALAGEIVGAPVHVAASPAFGRPIDGIIVDESLSMLRVRIPGRSRPVSLPKSALSGTIALPGGELPLRGEHLRVRPEDRTKRLLVGGPRRFR